MKYLLVFSLFILSFHFSAFGQEQPHDAVIDYNMLYKSVMDEYGFDQVLVNGIFFEDKYSKMVGHPFFLNDHLNIGTLIYKGKVYKSIGLKFDIYDHRLILYIQNNDLAVMIVPPADFISDFSFGGKYFSKYNIQGEPGFYQVVFDAEKLKCLYYWSKQLNETYYGGNNISYEFADSEKKIYLMLNDSIITCRNNRSFIEIFPEEIKARVRQYIEENHIKVTRSSDVEISEFLGYCNSLL
jgi:hypothetical protein